MKTKEILTKAETRLARIKSTSRFLKSLIALDLIFAPYEFAVYLGWLPLFRGHKILISPHQLYASAAEIPGAILALGLVRLGLSVFCFLALFNLFWLYERGILFSARNVRCIRFLGYCLIIDYIVLYQLESSSHDMALSFTQPFIGLMIIFIAWIMDEGRKIQEEQELTV